jgi:hypothetical protein
MPRYQRPHAAHGRDRGDLVGQQHAAGKRCRPAAGQAQHGTAILVQLPQQLTDVTGTGRDGPGRVVARSAVAGPIGCDHGNAAVAGRAGEGRELPPRPGGAVQRDHRATARIAHYLVRKRAAVGQGQLSHGADSTGAATDGQWRSWSGPTPCAPGADRFITSNQRDFTAASTGITITCPAGLPDSAT